MKVLLAGESWVTYGFHIKGFAAYTTGSYNEGGGELIDALRGGGAQVEHMPNHAVTELFPWSARDLDQYQVVILSDVSADTLLLHPDSLERGQRTGDRCQVLADWVRGGGSLLMIGGWMSFSGYEGRARYQHTALAPVLPVDMLGFDDRIEVPAGVQPEVVAEHPVVNGLAPRWPWLLGYNRVVAKPGAQLVARCGADPLLVVDSVGDGRVAAFTSDCAPHWAGAEFMAWDGYGRLWTQLVRWLARADD